MSDIGIMKMTGFSAASEASSPPDGDAVVVAAAREESFRGDEPLLLKLVNSLPETIFRTDEQGRFVFLSDGWERVCGWAPADCLGKTMLDFLVKRFREPAMLRMGEIMCGDSGDEICHHEMLLQPREGAPRWVRISCRAMRTTNEQCDGIAGCVTDIHSQKQAELELELHQTALRSIEDGIFITDETQPNNPIIHVNPAYERMTGWTAAESIGKNPRFLQGPNLGKKELATIRNAIATGTSCEVTLRNCRKDGSTFWNRLRLAPIHDESRNVVNYVGSLVDMSERLQIESELRAALEQITESSRHKASFLAAMSHELRTPLHAILGSSEILEEEMLGEINDRQREHVRNISESGSHLLNLINDILDLSKIEAGKEELDFQPVDLTEICEGSLMLVRQQATEKEIRLASDLPPEVVTMVADPRRLKQILVNLLTNAVKFTPPTGLVGIRVTLGQEESDICFEVWDTGIGIRPENQECLFEPFFQLDDATARDNSGIGLGLSLVKNLVDLHGGRIKLDSEVGKGSRFVVVLPLGRGGRETGETELGATEEAMAGSTREIDAAGKNRILLAEDNEFNRDTIRTFLEAHNYQVNLARDGLEAIRLGNKLRPDLIIMDVQMPHMDGIEATRRLRLEPGMRDIPIIALTALAMPGDKEKCLAAGMNDYFSKPIRLKLLLEHIQNQLR